jgi:CheY-like chemotaxis protein
MGEKEGDIFRVLLVEDEALVAILIEDMLHDSGDWLVNTASSLSKASITLNRQDTDIAILDVNVGGSPVYPFASVLAERNIPFVFVTGYREADIPPAFCDRPVLSKPFREAELLQIMRRFACSRPQEPD